jgi:hypothetical protein
MTLFAFRPRWLLAGLLVLMTASFGAAAPFTALRDGERFRYRTGWGIFGNAGEVIIEAHRDTLDGRSIFRITTQISSRGIVRGLYTFDNWGELVIDEATSRVLRAAESGQAGSKKQGSLTVFDYERGVARHTDEARPHRNREFVLPPGDPIDLISALIQTREWQAHVGERREALVYFGRDLYPIVLRADGKEDVRTPRGTIPTLRLVPSMEREEPRGVFRKGGEIKVWVSEREPRLPVQMQLKLNFGSALLTLVEHSVQPRTAERPANAERSDEGR